MKQLDGVDSVDYVVSHHAEQDHAGSIPAVLHRFAAAKVLASPKGKGMLVDHLHISLAELFSLTSYSLSTTAAPGVPSDISLDQMVVRGMYPAVHDRQADPAMWYESYYTTCLERDIRELTAVHDLGRFDTFVRMCAARSGSVLNLSSLSSDSGVSTTTAKNWITLLQRSAIIRLTPPHYKNFSKRLTKAPKVHFLDSGLLCYLLRIRSEEQFSLHPMRGNIFESFIVSEIIKSFTHAGQQAPVYYWRDNKGRQIDLVVETAEGVYGVEMKSAETFNPSFTHTLRWWANIGGDVVKATAVVYGGDQELDTGGSLVRSWRRALRFA
jgi:hypothetical protein